MKELLTYVLAIACLMLANTVIVSAEKIISGEFDFKVFFKGALRYLLVLVGVLLIFYAGTKVEWANGDYDYMTVITEHDNNRPNLNTTFKQGEIYSHMGTAGGVI